MPGLDRRSCQQRQDLGIPDRALAGAIWRPNQWRASARVACVDVGGNCPEANKEVINRGAAGMASVEGSESLEKPWYKRLGTAVASRVFRYVLQSGPRSQNLRVLDLSQGHCPPFAPMKQPAILIMWHECIALPIGLGFHSPVALLVSQHRDANFLNSAAADMGFSIVRGSTTRGGSTALRKLKELSTTHSMVITPDGPKGPRRTMNMGAVYLASLLQMPLVPVGVGLRNPWRLNTWDRFAVPKVGHRARIIFGPTISVPRRCAREDLERLTLAVGEDLNYINEVADDWANGQFEYDGARRLNWRGHWIPAHSGSSFGEVPQLNQSTRTACDELAQLNTPGAPSTDHVGSRDAVTTEDASSATKDLKTVA